MDTETYKRQLLGLEAQLAAQIERSRTSARDILIEPAHDVGDASVVDELKEEKFIVAENDGEVLTLVREVLGRIEQGTYGRCLVDGGPIEESRLAAVPWTAYCVQHQRELEASKGVRRVSL